MELILEMIKFLFYSLLIVAISKYLLVVLIRKLAMTLNLKPKTIGNIAGIATSIPELLTVSFSASSGLISTSWYNILSSNTINFIQYLFAIFLNKNQKILSNLALKIDLLLVILTILFPFGILLFSFSVSLTFLPIFLLLFILFYFINKNTHLLYLPHFKSFEELELEKESKWLKGKRKKTMLYSISLFLSSILLFFIGNLLSNTLETLCIQLKVSEFFIGIALGFITSLPELITFFESQRHHNEQNASQKGVIEATNNLLTSNMMNLFIIQSIGILIFHLSN